MVVVITSTFTVGPPATPTGIPQPPTLTPKAEALAPFLMATEADLITEIRYLTGLMRKNCHDASWRIERLLSKIEQGASLDTRSTPVQLEEARNELNLLMRDIEGIEKLCEMEMDDSR